MLFILHFTLYILRSRKFILHYTLFIQSQIVSFSFCEAGSSSFIIHYTFRRSLFTYHPVTSCHPSTGWEFITFYFCQHYLFYEAAILEYEKVTKNYPNGNKVSYALLKQGLSFLNLGDKTSAKLLLQEVIKDYPNTSQARIARSTLQEIK